MKEGLVSKFLVLATLCLLIGMAHAQDLYFKQLIVENGLSQEDVSSVTQDSFGFIWVGTYDGLNRFDGREIKTFRRETANPSSLPDNRISALAEDHKKRLWIGTQGGSFAYYSLYTDQFKRIESPDNIGGILKFFLDKDQSLFALTSTGILRLLDDQEPFFEYLPTSQNLHYKDVTQTREGDIVFVGNSGFSILRDGQLEHLSNPDKIVFNSVVKSDLGLLAGGNKGIYLIDPQTVLSRIKNAQLPTEQITSMLIDNDKNLWIGTNDKGLFHFDRSLALQKQIIATRTNQRGLLSNRVQELFIDAANNLWVGSRQGLCYSSLNNDGINHIKLQELFRPNVRNLYVNGDDLLLGITNEGLYKYDMVEHNLTQVTTDEINFVNHIDKYDETIFVSCDLGLLALATDYSVKSIYTITDYPQGESPNIRCVAMGGQDVLHVGTAHGVMLLKNKKLQWLWNQHPQLRMLSNYFVFRLHYDPSRRQMLVGTRSKGLLIINMDAKGNYLNLTTEGLVDVSGNSISNTSVWSFYQSENGSIWVGTDIGLFKRSSTDESFEQIPTVGIRDKKIL
ncbi:MAG: two-component regulator propeller domain-containing protein, partial [Bacteroidota bacterium]